MGKLIGYGKLGRSMPLTLEKCGTLGGDVEMVAVIRDLALRHPQDTFFLIGRNSGETAEEAGLPSNVVNPWADDFGWKRHLTEGVAHAGLKGEVLTPRKQLELAEIFDGITFPLFERLDAMVMWIGQHGTSNTPIPKVGDPNELTKPQDWCAWYSGFMLRGINHWRDVDPWNREEVNLNADARNRHKMRDLKWPLRYPVLTQFDGSKTIKHHRYGDPLVAQDRLLDGNWCDYGRRIDDGTWSSTIHERYARLEVNALTPGNPFGDLISFNGDWNRPGHFGLFINEARAIGVRPELSRLQALTEYALPLNPHFVHGTWSSPVFKDTIKPVPWDQYYPKLHSVRCTLTTPSSGSGWATTKPWEAFAAGTVCFFHPAYDTQNHILSDAPTDLMEWLRVTSPEELNGRVAHLNSHAGIADWTALVHMQRSHFDAAMRDLTYMRLIEERIYGQV